MKVKPTYEELERRVQELEKNESEHKYSKEALRESESLFKMLYEKAPLGYQSLDENGRFIVVNQTWLDTLGYTREEVIGKFFADFLHSDWGDHFKENFPRFKAIGEILGVEFEMVKKNGDLILVSFNGKISRDEKGNFQQTHCIFHDITERKLAEEKERESNKKFKGLFDSNPSAAFVWEFDEHDFTLIAVNRSAQNLTENRAKDYIGLQAKTIYADLPIIREKIAECHAKQVNVEFELFYKNRFKGEHNWNAFQLAFLKPNNVILYVDNISNRKNAQEKIEFQAKLLNSIGQSVIATDKDGLIIYWNDIAEEIFGWSAEEVLGQNIFRIMSQDITEANEIMKKIIFSQSLSGEFNANRKDGTIVPLFVTVTPFYDEVGNLAGVIGVSADISQQKELQNQLHQAQKMESVGRLTGGVAHDFNNILSVITGYSEMILEQMDPSDSLYSDVEKILEAGNRSAEIISQLLAFSRKQTIAPRILNLNDTVEGMLKMLMRLIGEDIDLSWIPSATSTPVRMDPSQIDQILANLCVNARDAIDGVGKVTIETGSVILDQEYCESNIGFIPGEFVTLEVSDTGVGIKKEIADKIFDPFFTTKGMLGTGLGLATVYGIVKQNDGFIHVYSEPGEGTTFKIYLPMQKDKTVWKAEVKAGQFPLSRGETILLVEDDMLSLEMAATMLERLNYRVIKTTSPQEALLLAEQFSGKIDLLITDVIMPEMNGKALSSQIVSLLPGLKVLYMSGYTANVIAHHGILDEGINFIQKPFSRRAVAEKIRDVLDSVHNV